MEKYSVYEDMASRTGGDIYIGVVGPVRTGKSTFIKRFMEKLVIPTADPTRRAVMTDELPQSSYGKTVMTTEPKFVPAQAEKIKNLGADYIIGQEVESIPSVFRRLEEEGTPVNVCMDCLGGEDLGEALSFMARGGYWVLISTLAGVETTVKLRPVLTKGLHLVGSMLRNRTNEMKAEILNGLVKEIWRHLETGTIKPSVYKVFPFEEVNEAHAVLERFENTGKVVLKIK